MTDIKLIPDKNKKGLYTVTNDTKKPLFEWFFEENYSLEELQEVIVETIDEYRERKERLKKGEMDDHKS